MINFGVLYIPHRYLPMALNMENVGGLNMSQNTDDIPPNVS